MRIMRSKKARKYWNSDESKEGRSAVGLVQIYFDKKRENNEEWSVCGVSNTYSAAEFQPKALTEACLQ